MRARSTGPLVLEVEPDVVTYRLEGPGFDSLPPGQASRNLAIADNDALQCPALGGGPQLAESQFSSH